MGDRIAVYPSRLALQNMKQRLLASQKGASLLKKRADALSIHYRATSSKALRNILDLCLAMKRARMMMATSEFATGNLTNQIFESVATFAKTLYLAKFDNVAGVRLLTFTPQHNDTFKSDNHMVGLARGADRLIKTRVAFEQVLDLVVKQAGFRYAMKAIDNMFDATNRRVNGIENVVVPRLERTVRYIISELDEEEREEYFRRKKVQFQKRKQAARRTEHHTTLDMQIEEKSKATIKRKSIRKSVAKAAARKFTITAMPLASYSQADVKAGAKAAPTQAKGVTLEVPGKAKTKVSDMVKKIETAGTEVKASPSSTKSETTEVAPTASRSDIPPGNPP